MSVAIAVASVAVFAIPISPIPVAPISIPAIAVAMVAIAVFGTRAVEQQGHIVVFLVVVVLLQFRQHAALHKP